MPCSFKLQTYSRCSFREYSLFSPFEIIVSLIDEYIYIYRVNVTVSKSIKYY